MNATANSSCVRTANAVHLPWHGAEIALQLAPEATRHLNFRPLRARVKWRRLPSRARPPRRTCWTASSPRGSRRTTRCPKRRGETWASSRLAFLSTEGDRYDNILVCTLITTCWNELPPAGDSAKNYSSISSTRVDRLKTHFMKRSFNVSYVFTSRIELDNIWASFVLLFFSGRNVSFCFCFTLVLCSIRFER